jgi:hypothetical protein
MGAAATVSLLTRGPAAPPSTTGELWVDISNYTGTLTAQGCHDLRAAGYVGCIVQAITGLDGRTYTRQQLTACVAYGLRVAGYVWCFPGASVTSIRDRLHMFDGYALEFLALDLEQGGLTRPDVERDLIECDAYIAAVPSARAKRTYIYSGKWYFDQQGWSNFTWWCDRPLWDSFYNGVPVAGHGFRPYGGWTKPTMSQFQGTSTVGSVSNVDLNVSA